MKVFPFSPLQFLLEAFAYFKKSTKENSPGAEMADLHIEDSTEGEEWETEGGRGSKKRREGARQHLCVNDLKTI